MLEDKPIKGLLPKYCEKCRWRSVVNNSCDYILFEDHGMRGCPPGEGCFRREIGKRRPTEVPVTHRRSVNTRSQADIAKALETNRQKAAAAYARRLELHAAGATDAEIAAAENISIRTASYWRIHAGLKPNKKLCEKPETPAVSVPQRPYMHQSPEVAARMERRMKLYLDGYSDAEIAKAEGSKAHSVSKWRNNRNLPANRKIGRPRTVRRKNA